MIFWVIMNQKIDHQILNIKNGSFFFWPRIVPEKYIARCFNQTFFLTRVDNQVGPLIKEMIDPSKSATDFCSVLLAL